MGAKIRGKRGYSNQLRHGWDNFSPYNVQCCMADISSNCCQQICCSTHHKCCQRTTAGSLLN